MKWADAPVKGVVDGLAVDGSRERARWEWLFAVWILRWGEDALAHSSLELPLCRLEGQL